MTAPLHVLDASLLITRLQRREISAEAVLRACLERIAQREPQVQAWTHLSATALAEAQALDRGVIRGPLHGVPVGVKDLFDTHDMPTTYGSPVYASHQPAADASVVALCRAAGAIIVGKTVTTEFATFHPGKTHNPHRHGYTPGGSSSGSAAAVADGMVPLALGTQTAASIIRPAAFCGVVGFKPSFGSIARAGIKPLAESLDTVGVFGRSVADVAHFAAIIAADDRLLLPLPRSDAPAWRVGVCHTFEWSRVDACTADLLEQGASRLAAAGMQVSTAVLPQALATMAQMQSDIMGYEAARNLADERRRHPALLSAALQALLAGGMAIGATHYQACQKAALQARALMDACFETHDVLLAPSTIGVATAGITTSGDPLMSRMWTLLGLPCIHLPYTTGALGLPLGLQLIGRYGEDAQLLRAAAWIHRCLQA